MTTLSRCIRTVPLLTALLALSGMQATAETIDELYAKAKQEKTLVFYGAGPTGAQDRWINEFQQRFPGVKVDLIGGLSPALTKRVDEQLARKAVEVDLASLQTIQDFARWKQAGAMLLFKPDGFDEIDPVYKMKTARSRLSASILLLTPTTRGDWQWPTFRNPHSISSSPSLRASLLQPIRRPTMPLWRYST